MSLEKQARVEGSVAKILNEREVAINRGSEHGVTEEMKFAILSQNPHFIFDPETREELGTVDRPKVLVKVSEVQEKFCIARTFETYTVNLGGIGFDLDLTTFLQGPRWVTRVKTLRVDESDLPGELSEADSIVKVGDRVVQIFDRETYPLD